MEKYDAVIIGFGKGGKTLAGYLAAKGEKVAMIEKSAQMYGSTCINVGCIPTKSLVDSAERAKIRAFAAFEQKAAFYQQAIERKRALVSMLRNKNYHMLADQENITVYHGLGSFVDAHEIQIAGDAGTEHIYGEKIFINTGAKPVIPPIAGAKESSRVYLSESIMELEQLPAQLVIIGGGYIGLEYASFYSMFGTKVTVLQNTADFIPREDREIAAAVQAEMERQGITFVFQADIKKIVDEVQQSYVEYHHGSAAVRLPADAILIATGRSPETQSLNLEAAQIEVLPRGGIRTDAERRTSQPHIWAMGDAAGGLQFTYVSLDDFRIVKASLEGGAYRDLGRNIPYSVFLEPALSRVGLTEAEAKAQGYEVLSASLPAAAIPKAHVLQKPQGLLKAVVDKSSGQILGATLYCAASYEMINLIKLAMDAKLPYTVLRDQIFTHPTMSEALNDLFGKLK